MLKSGKCDSVVSVVEIPHLYAPQKALYIQNGFLQFWWDSGRSVTRRQQLEPTYAREGTVYACLRDVVIVKSSLYGDRCLPMVLPSAESLNLDSMADWQLAEEILKGRKRQPVKK